MYSVEATLEQVLIAFSEFLVFGEYFTIWAISPIFTGLSDTHLGLFLFSWGFDFY